MRGDLQYQPITVQQFLRIDFASDRKYELVGGMIRMMTGGSPAHARVSANIVSFLHQRLRGSGCRAYGSDMGVQIGEIDVRYPDVSVFCGDPASVEAEERLVYADPVVIFEVLSPSTSKGDQNEKLGEYREVAALQTIVFVDPINELTRVVQRLGPDSWRDDLFAKPRDVNLPSLSLVVPHHEIFGRD
ncbi:Uma2 family endonuclease [Sphingomonas bacterium]|uniref:Uma2 family endonuclease n=1 Tax=Sphingomonas bacterium TaxID=1895847 RepID=UPI0015754F96|nr:Uma2 family endonuclease [Sphingomonas bacterium]